MLKRFVAPLIVLTALTIALVMQFVAAKKVNKPAHGHLKLLGIGPADSPSTDNRGFIALQYCYIDFQQDYVFIRLYDRNTQREIVHEGTIPGLSAQKSMKRLVKSIQATPMPARLFPLHGNDNSCENDYVINFSDPGFEKDRLWFFQHDLSDFSYRTLIDTLARNPHLKALPIDSFENIQPPRFNGDSLIRGMEFFSYDKVYLDDSVSVGAAR